MAHGGQKGVKAHSDHGRRAHGPDKATRKARAKAQDPRYKEAMAETNHAREALEELIAKQAENPAIGETPGAIYQRKQRELALARAQELEDEYARAEESIVEFNHASEVIGDLIAKRREKEPKPPKVVEVECERVYVQHVHQIDLSELPAEGDGDWRFSWHTARLMLKEGYNIKHVIKYTGIGYDDLKDFPLDEEGYGIVDSLEGEEE